MSLIYAIAGTVVTFALAIFGAVRWGGNSANRKRDAEQSQASLDAELNRRKLEDDIDQDDDLVARAKRSGLLRDDPE